MKGFDCYCALCGGPFTRIRWSRDPPAATRDSEEVEMQDAEDDDEDEAMLSDDGDEDFEDEDEIEDDEGDADDDDGADEDDDNDSTASSPVAPGAYDPDILTRADVAWTKRLVALGFNPLAKGASKAFISGPGTYVQDGTVDVESGTDPNADEVDTYMASCYKDNLHLEPLFPFHIQCAQLLMRELTGDSNPAKLDKDALYGACQSLMGESIRRLGVAYHEHSTNQDIGPQDLDQWLSVAGLEYLVASPLSTEATKAQVKADLDSKIALAVPEVRDLSAKVKTDPFARIPADIIHGISAFLDSTSLLSLDAASWHVHAKIHGDQGFWKARTKHGLAWFSELHDAIGKAAASHPHDAKALFLWAMKVSEPRQGLSGPYMAIANRRRIWSVAEKFKHHYDQRLSRATGYELVDNTIQDNTACDLVPFVSAPVCPQRNLRETFWLHHGEEISGEQHVETFWADDGSLVGISVAPTGERRLFGLDDSEPAVRKETVKISEGDWIRSFDLHMQIFKPTRTAAEEESGVGVSPSGITIHLESGLSHALGDTDTECLRHLEAQNGSCIVGAIGEIGPFRSKTPATDRSQEQNQAGHRILRFGIIQVKASVLHRASKQRIVNRGEPVLDRYLWNAKSAFQGQQPIWEWPRLNVDAFSGVPQQWAAHYCHEDMLPVEAFMWAHSPAELRSLVRIEAVIAKKKLPSKKGAKGKGRRKKEKFLLGILTLRAEYTPESGLKPRHTRLVDAYGEEISETEVEVFEIDGPGGEYINEIMTPMSGTLGDDESGGLMLCTNRKRSVCFAEPEEPAWAGMTERKTQAMVGIVVSFGMLLRAKDNAQEQRRQAVLGFCAGLTLPKGKR